MQSYSSSYYPSAICSDGIAVDCIRIVGLIQGCQDTVIGLYITRLLQDQVIYTCFQFIYPFALFLLPQLWQGYRIGLPLCYEFVMVGWCYVTGGRMEMQSVWGDCSKFNRLLVSVPLCDLQLPQLTCNPCNLNAIKSIPLQTFLVLQSNCNPV